ncbi:MAG: acetylglutamate kinase [Actinobacteria bacterium]|nr:acetylglutamate kinase [Actinomycetota bacterium]
MISHLTPQQKASVLVEALPWLERFRNATIVVKFGGNAMVNQELLQAFAADIAFLRLSGLRPVVVHGGGPQISAELTARGLVSEFVGGYRVTTAETMTVVREVLVNEVQAQLVNLINQHGDFAVGISGDQHKLLTAQRRDAIIDGEPVDIGFVGDVTEVNPDSLLAVLENGQVPVVSTVALDDAGNLYNVNADTAASAIAVALNAEKFVVLTDVPGLYRNWPDTSDLISQIPVSELEQLIGTLETGMVPKMEACLRAVTQGVPEATVVDGRQEHCVLLEVFTDEGVGTMVVPG